MVQKIKKLMFPKKTSTDGLSWFMKSSSREKKKLVKAATKGSIELQKKLLQEAEKVS